MVKTKTKLKRENKKTIENENHTGSQFTKHHIETYLWNEIPLWTELAQYLFL